MGYRVTPVTALLRSRNGEWAGMRIGFFSPLLQSALSGNREKFLVEVTEQEQG
jgi:hypothetical protein